MKKIIISFIFVAISALSIAQTNNIKVTLTGGYPNLQIKSKIEKNTTDLLTQINNAVSQNQDSLYISGIEIDKSKIEDIRFTWNSLRFYCSSEIIKAPLLKIPSGYELRNILIKTADDSREIVIEYDKEGTICGLHFALSKTEWDMMSGNRVEDKTREKIILNFIETLKTAYIKKDADFIETMYDDKALIIVGKTVKKTEQNNAKFLDSRKEMSFYNGASYTKLTKTEYMENLKNVFKKNKKIAIDFEDITVSRHKKKSLQNFYGVKLKQKWAGDNYKDVGYVFFAIEFREKDNPIIWVRSWQDIKDTAPIDRFGLEDLDIAK